MTEKPSDPRTWTLDVDQASIDLYRELSARPRALSVAEAAQMVALVDAWRAAEQRKHLALMAALNGAVSAD